MKQYENHHRTLREWYLTNIRTDHVQFFCATGCCVVADALRPWRNVLLYMMGIWSITDYANNELVFGGDIMDYLLTGVTGLVGRHLLFELLEKIKTAGSKSIVYLLVRPKKDESARERVLRLFCDGEAPDNVRNRDRKWLLERVRCIEQSLADTTLATALQGIPSDELVVLHCAGSTNLLLTREARREVAAANYHGTVQLLNSLEGVAVSRFIYISTAFSCGIQHASTVIPHDFSTIKVADFRNPYERCKYLTERTVEGYCRKRDLPVQILRPAIVCGRLIDPPLYVTNKFDVFYGWAKFFYHMQHLADGKKVRIAINREGSLNIVPVDYVAKVIAEVMDNDEVSHLNIVNSVPVRHVDSIPVMLQETAGIPYELVDEVPKHQTDIERRYYKTAGRVFAPYITTHNQVFEPVVSSCCALDEGDVDSCFPELIKYAVRKQFKDPDDQRVRRRPSEAFILTGPVAYTSDLASKK